MELNQYICVFSTKWGAHSGGINVFNQEMCKGLKEASKQLKIVCVVDDYDLDEELNAKKEEIVLIKCPKDKHATSIIEILHKQGIFPSVWLGHDIYTGQLAIDCSKQTISISGVISHFDYELYASYKGNTGKVVEEKMLRQQSILKHADMKFAVGPKLKNTILRLMENDQTTIEDPIELSPGCFTIDIQPSKYTSEVFLAMSSGRLGTDDDNIKRTSIVMEAFSKISKEICVDKMLTLFGVEESMLETIAKNNKDNMLNIKALEFSKNRNHIFQTLSKQTMFIMPSIHEGFGLTGLEAISMEIPLILTINSGLYAMLVKNQLEKYVYPLYITGDHTDDLNQIYQAMQSVWINQDEYKKNAKHLKKELSDKKITWKQVGKTIIDKILTKKLEKIFPTNTFNFNEFMQEEKLLEFEISVENLFFQYKKILDPNNGVLEKHYGYILYQIISMYQNYCWDKEQLNGKRKKISDKMKEYMDELLALLEEVSNFDFSTWDTEELQTYSDDSQSLCKNFDSFKDQFYSFEKIMTDSREDISKLCDVYLSFLENMGNALEDLESFREIHNLLQSTIEDINTMEAEKDSFINQGIGPLSEEQEQIPDVLPYVDALSDLSKLTQKITLVKDQFSKKNNEMKAIIEDIQNTLSYLTTYFHTIKPHLINTKHTLQSDNVNEKKYINYCLFICICLETFLQKKGDIPYCKQVELALKELDLNMTDELKTIYQDKSIGTCI